MWYGWPTANAVDGGGMDDLAPGTEALSAREQEVAEAYRDGQSYKEIARSLEISPATVRTHLRTVYRKLGITSKLELSDALRHDTAPSIPGRRDDADLVAELALELDEAMRRERILARVLRIISQQGDSLDAVIDAVLDHALEICEAEFVILFEYHDDLRFRAMRSRNIAPAFGEWLAEQDVFAVDSGTGLGRVATTRQTVNITDVRGEDIYRSEAPLRIATADLGRARSFAAIPMLSGDRLIGAFTVYRTRVHPFNDRALELAQLFADQAAIAIDNARSRASAEDRQRETPGPSQSHASSGKPIPLLALLPFRPVDEDDTELAGTGRRLAACLAMELSTTPLFRVIDQASSFSAELTNSSPVEASERLGADLVASGLIRRLPSGGFRIGATLSERGGDGPLWTEMFEARRIDEDPLMESLLSRMCGAIGTGVERRLVGAAGARPSQDPGAMDHFLKGLDLHHRHEHADFVEARTHFESALKADPDFGRAAAALAITYVREWFFRSDRMDLLEIAEGHARTAMGRAPHDAWAHTVWGVVALYKHRHRDAALCFDRAMELAPNDAYVVSRCGLGRLYAGDFASAIDLLRQSIELDPLHADRQHGMLGHALFHVGRHDEAIIALKRIARPLAWELAWLAANLAMKGDRDEARDVAARFHDSIAASGQPYRAETRPFRDPDDMKRLLDGMNAAGISTAD